MSADVMKARSMVAVESKRGDQAALLAARRELAAAKLAQYIRKVVSEAPELTDEQLDAIAMLLRPKNGGAARAGDAA
ncbi:MAG: hypothetical protein J0I04_02480 [Paenarthrobacter ureafaciens]|uniref:hypothetical protein n=1 Tax=Paenarthrobacter ureafaciens TaxID=37931 RepID=UPI001AC9FED6|nr:hypothetical protein [Paenarthrobacter ureafaciens]MBN9128505.1 hypothetical protein [Paenarthrobacter ureafaciens]